MAKHKNQGPPHDSNEIMIFVAIVLIGVLFWWAFRVRIAGIILGLRLIESSVFSLFTSNLDDLRIWMRGIDRRLVTASDMYKVSHEVGSYLRFLTTPVLIFLGYKLYKNSPVEKFKRTFTHETLPVAQADVYPWMKISTKINISAMDPEIGPWAYAKTERMFAREYKLRGEKGEYDKIRAEQIFIKQLGPIWLGYKHLKPHAKGIFAMLAARVNKDFKSSDKLLIQLAESAAMGEMNYAGVDELAAKHMESKAMQRIIRQHAYEKTVLMAMVEKARGGVAGKDYLPPNWFLWLKGVDRPLWYALSDIGRMAPHVESAGVFSHWLMESMRRKRLEMPFVKNAVEGLAIELAKFTEDGDEGISEDDDLLELHLSEAKAIPSPEEAEFARQQKVIAKGVSGGKRIDSPAGGSQLDISGEF
jgi:intracellular multiplication protein IcmP